jgi:hypothetical protein
VRGGGWGGRIFASCAWRPKNNKNNKNLNLKKNGGENITKDYFILF